ncbi:helix-turn-helix domain-containing protein [Dyadobacter arcticus]|uniref:HTH-type transcriptional regulator/antitoxin HigA n=1 Tax=Dyadobacter arcticus TaxID=1078754 RepID=A0ABX0UP03_9BACT|nr:transcriptional regulator [Dyadobacter arcticus]NIJ52791.1 HTH-type transcriptional regulator/antitoxin HigA [Dyadobacter arcticus]
MMELKPIKKEEDYDRMLAWVDEQFDKMPAPESPEGNTLQIVLLLIKAYEDEHYVIPLPDPIEAIKLKMNEKGLKSKDLVEWVGSKSYVSALLNRKKPLTLKLAKLFHEKLGIPAQVLLG